MDMKGTSVMGMPWRVRRCLFSLGQGIASDVCGGSLEPPCSRSLVDGTPKTRVWSPLLCLRTGATEHINRGQARSEIEFQSNRSIADASQTKIVTVTCCCYQMDLPARSSWALIELSVGLGGLYSDPIIVSGYEYNLLKYPVPEADILIRISAEGVIRNQIRRIGVYPYRITAQKPYPDNP